MLLSWKLLALFAQDFKNVTIGEKDFSHTCHAVKLIGNFPRHYFHIALSFSGFYSQQHYSHHTLYSEIKDCFHRKLAKLIDFLLANKWNRIHSQQTSLVKLREFAVMSGADFHML